MVEVAAFMVICWLGWKFARLMWDHREPVTHWLVLSLRVTGIGLLLAAVGLAAWWAGTRGIDLLWAALHHQTVTPGEMLAGTVLLMNGARWLTRSRKPQALSAAGPTTAEFKDFMGMGR
jgi:hypothetical protein